jgi:hypothetical protein
LHGKLDLLRSHIAAGGDFGGAHVFAARHHGSPLGVAPKYGGKCNAAQWVVARAPFSGPAAPQTRAPVQTEKTYLACNACRRMNS